MQKHRRSIHSFPDISGQEEKVKRRLKITATHWPKRAPSAWNRAVTGATCLLTVTFIAGGLTHPTTFCLFKQQGRRGQLVVNGLTKLPELPPAARK